MLLVIIKKCKSSKSSKKRGKKSKPFKPSTKSKFVKTVIIKAMLVTWTYLLISSLVQINTGFNLEPRLPLIKYGHPDSYFGYSVAEHVIINNDDRKPV